MSQITLKKNFPSSVTEEPSDICSKFIFDNLYQPDDKCDTISMRLLVEKIRDWVKINHPGKRSPIQKEVRYYVEKQTNFYDKKGDCMTYHKIKPSYQEYDAFAWKCDSLY